MTRQEEYDLLVEMIDNTQQKIRKEPKERLHLLAELEKLQDELREMQTRKQARKILPKRRARL